MEGAKRSHGRDEHAHRMGVVSETLHHVVDLCVIECVRHNLLPEELVLVRRWQLPKNEQESHLKEGALLGQSSDVITAVLKDALLSVDVGDCGFLNENLTQLTVFMYPGS